MFFEVNFGNICKVKERNSKILAMKIQSVLVSLGLGFLGSFSIGTVSQNFPIISARAIAQTVSSSCPLPADIAITFLNSECKEVKLEKAQDFYRYFGNSVSKYGRYLTSDQYTTNSEAIKKLALNQDWGNPASKKVTVTLPAGMTVYQGIAAPQNPATCYPGGGQQIFIKDSRDATIKWSDGEDVTIQSFCCK